MLNSPWAKFTTLAGADQQNEAEGDQRVDRPDAEPREEELRDQVHAWAAAWCGLGRTLTPPSPGLLVLHVDAAIEDDLAVLVADDVVAAEAVAELVEVVFALGPGIALDGGQRRADLLGLEAAGVLMARPSRFTASKVQEDWLSGMAL